MKKSLFFCYACGRSAESLEELHDNLCQSCFEKKEKEKLFKKISEKTKNELVICRDCFSYFYSGKWIEPESYKTLEQILETQIKDNLKEISELRNWDIKIDSFKMKSRNKGEAYINLKANIGGKLSKNELKLKFPFSFSKCERCIRVKSSYYEAIIQLRGEEDKIKEAEKEIADIIERNKSQKSFISKREKIKIKHGYGVDLYIGSSKIAKKIARYFRNRHDAEIKESAKLYSRKGGKNLYRITLLIRFKENGKEKHV